MKFPGFRWSTAACAACTLAVAVLAAGCSVAATATPVAPPPEQGDIAVDVFPTIDFAGLYIAQMDGLFKRQGLNVTIRFAPAGQLAATSVLNGTSDIAGTDYVTYVNNELNGNARLRIIAEASSLQPHQLEMLVSAHSRITSLAELRRHTIGVTAPNDIDTLLVRALLAENDVGADQVNIRFGFQLLNVAGQVSDGQADAAPIPEPFATEGEQLFGLQELADVDQGVTTNFPLEGYAVSQAWARKNPRTVAAFDRALTEAQQIADTDRAAVEAAAEKFLGIIPETAAVINLPSFPLSVAPAQLQRVVDTMVQFGMLPPRDIAFKVTEMTG